MHKVRLSFSGHYPDRIVEVTDAELQELQHPTKNWQTVVNEISQRPWLLDDEIPTFVVYE